MKCTYIQDKNENNDSLIHRELHLQVVSDPENCNGEYKECSSTINAFCWSEENPDFCKLYFKGSA